MTKFLIASLALLAAVPASANTTPMVIQFGSPDRVASALELTVTDRIENAAEAACERPFMRDLKAQRLYRECLDAARAEAEAIVARRSAGAELAAR